MVLVFGLGRGDWLTKGKLKVLERDIGHIAGDNLKWKSSFDFMGASVGIGCENPGLNSIALDGRTES